MRNCDEYKEMISDYLDNELDSYLFSEFENHVENCISCKNELEDCKMTVNLIKSITEEELPVDFKHNLHAKLINEKINNTKKNNAALIKNKYFRIIGSMAAVLIFAFIINGFYGKQVSMTSSTQNALMPKVAYAPDKGGAPNQRSVINGTSGSAAKSKIENNDANVSTSENSHVNAGTSVITSKKSQVNGSMSESSSDSTSTNTIQPTFSSAAKIMGDVKFSRPIPVITDQVIKNTEITLEVNDPKKEVEEVKVKIEEQGAKLINNINTQTFAQYNLKALKVDDNIRVDFMINKDVLDKVIDSLKAIWGDTSIVTQKLNDIKFIDKINELTSELTELDTQSKNLDNSEQNKVKLNELDTQKNAIQAEIDDLKSNVDYTIVSILVMAKK
jgi:hypothetical protein